MKSSTAFSLHWWMTSHVFIKKNALLTHILSTLFSSTSVLFSCTPFGTKSTGTNPNGKAWWNFRKTRRRRRKERWLPEQCRWKRPNLLELSVRETGLETTGSCITTNLTHWGVTSTQAKTLKRICLRFRRCRDCNFPRTVKLKQWSYTQDIYI